ncbi:MAG: hypothetical protein KatS3mg124_2163 [Porticoccaceae bacterium]|nr:MAG: hypothetical protein KatS3mg124_2163 [Porticoccaceae bacterium]
MGRVTRSSISRADAPGMDTITSIIGTLIWGSSSRGNMSTANAPNKTEVTTSRGVSFESMNDRASRPAKPKPPWGEVGFTGGSLMAVPGRRGSKGLATRAARYGIFTGWPSRRGRSASTISISPAARPDTTSTSSPNRFPVLTSRSAARPSSTT